MRKAKIIEQNKYKFLWIDNELWMWDIPVERKIQKNLAEEAFGDVLIGGYGLGLVHEHLLKNPKVKSITTVEKFPQVIKEIKRVCGKIHGQIVIGDFYKYKSNQKFDCIIGDTWAEIVPESLRAYNKFVKKAKMLVKKKGKILAFGKDFFEFLNIKRYGTKKIS